MEFGLEHVRYLAEECWNNRFLMVLALRRILIHQTIPQMHYELELPQDLVSKTIRNLLFQYSSARYRTLF